MNNVKPILAQTFNSALYTRLSDAANSNIIIAGRGLESHAGSGGHVLSVKENPRPTYMNYQGIFNESASYNVDDVVYVPPSGSYSVPVSNGSWICVVTVPAAASDYNFFLDNIVPAYDSANVPVTDVIANQYQWTQYNTYYPTNYSGSAGVTSDSGYNINSNVQFWIPLGAGGGGTINWYLYNENAAYSQGNLVWVDPNVHYTQSFTSASNGGPVLNAGAFFVKINVPGSGSISGSSSRPPISWYYPHYPVEPSASIVTSGPYISQSANLVYFEPISPMMVLGNLCNNGSPEGTLFVCAVLSGSFFDSSKLAYHG